MMVSDTKWIILTVFTGLALTTCKEVDFPENTPDCIIKRIRKFSRKAACDMGARVTRYDFQGQVVYVFGPGNCGADMSAAVVDQDCNTICSLGGFTGNIVCNGDTLYLEATNEKTVWQN